MEDERHTPVIFSELNQLLKFQLISVHLCIEAIVLLENTCQGSYPGVNTAPVGNALASLHFWHNIFEMFLSE